MNSIKKTGFSLAVAVALATSLFACAMPGEEDQEKTATEQTEQDESELRIGIGGGGGGGGDSCGGTECNSDDGNQKCSCGTGERCVKTTKSCWCEKATRLCGFGGGGGGVVMY
jgi:hypothetical protein